MQILNSARTRGPSPNKFQSLQNSVAQRTSSPMGNFVNNLYIDDQIQKPLSKQLNNLRAFIQPLTPPMIPTTPENYKKKKQDTQHKQTMTTRKHYENMNQQAQYLLAGKSGKSQNSSILQKTLKSQKNSSSNISISNHNYQTNQEPKRATSFYQILKEKDSNNLSYQQINQRKVNFNVQSIYGIKPTEQRPETARTKCTEQITDNSLAKQKNDLENVFIEKNIFQKPQQIEDDKDLFYEIIKQRKNQKKITCINHQNRYAPYSMFQEQKNVFMCADCSIQQAYNGKIIYLDNNQLCYKIEKQLEWNIIQLQSEQISQQQV